MGNSPWINEGAIYFPFNDEENAACFQVVKTGIRNLR